MNVDFILRFLRAVTVILILPYRAMPALILLTQAALTLINILSGTLAIIIICS